MYCYYDNGSGSWRNRRGLLLNIQKLNYLCKLVVFEAVLSNSDSKQACNGSQAKRSVFNCRERRLEKIIKFFVGHVDYFSVSFVDHFLEKKEHIYNVIKLVTYNMWLIIDNLKWHVGERPSVYYTLLQGDGHKISAIYYILRFYLCFFP